MDIPSSELRRQRDAIRHEMEQLVRTMQRLEPDVEQKRPGWEQKREELAQHRARLSELRAKMRAVMDASSSATVTNNLALLQPVTSSSAVSAPKSTTHQHSPPSAPSGGRQLFPQSSPQGSAATISTNAATLQTRHVSPKRHGSPSSASTRHSTHYSTSQQLAELSSVHQAEKQRLTEEFQQAMESLDRRHAKEASELEIRLHQEEAHLREYEIARQRMEEAQRHLEALKRTPSVLTTRPSHPPELELFARR